MDIDEYCIQDHALVCFPTIAKQPCPKEEECHRRESFLVIKEDLREFRKLSSLENFKIPSSPRKSKEAKSPARLKKP